MALTNCKDCKGIISDTAASCVHCGVKSTAKQPDAEGNCLIGCLGMIGMLFFFFGGCQSTISTPVKSSYTAPQSPPVKSVYEHQTPMIKSGLNSVWVYKETLVYKKPKEKNPVGKIVRKASVVVEPVDYDWVKIFDAPVRPVGGGDFLPKVRGLYIKRYDLITSSPEKWPDDPSGSKKTTPASSVLSAPAAPSTPSTPRVKSEAVENSGWDGSVWQAHKYLKKVLKDPGSLEYIGWTPVRKNATGYEVGVSYRAKNSFGGYGIENKLFKFDNQGNVISCD